MRTFLKFELYIIIINTYMLEPICSSTVGCNPLSWAYVMYNVPISVMTQVMTNVFHYFDKLVQ